MPLPNLTIVLGGAASGKSAYAESLVLKGEGRPIYIATAQIFDAEMAEKIAHHQQMRGDGWVTIEEPLDIAGALGKCTGTDPILIDCATLWLTNVILGEHDVEHYSNTLMSALADCPAPVVIVSNEVGQGIVPDNALSRRFRNAQGRLNQRLAAEAGLVVAVMAGIPLTLKGDLP